MSRLRTSILRKRSVRILMRCVIVAVAVGLITTGALAATSSHHPTYRTATVTRAAVNETLERTGTIEPVSQATVAFPTSGTIADVAVAVGDTVATGKTLATLDTTSLQATLTAKESALANAELILHKALNGESSGPTGGNGGANTNNGGANTADVTNAAAQPSAATVTTTDAGANPGPSGGAVNATLTAARNAVTKAETAVRAALASAQRALATATQACNTTTTTTSTTMPSTTTTTVSAAPPLSCSEAQAALLRAQQKVADAETTLASAENKLAGILASTTTPTGGGSNTPSSTPTNTTPKASGSTITADQLVADEANVAAALADVNVANETLAQATIVSPITGTIADVNLSAGTQVSADSSTANVVIVGRGGYEVTTTITVADRPKVSVGDAATVTPDGSSAKLAGKVVSIGVATTSSNSSTGGSSSTTSYPVSIGFTSEPAGLRNGASSAVTIVVAHTDSALTVPTSAVTTIGTGFHTVTVLADGKTSTVSIQIGTVGADRTAVTSGLRAGQAVILADFGQAIPSSNTTTRFGGGLGGGGFGGGGFGGGGTGGGGFGRGG